MITKDGLELFDTTMKWLAVMVFFSVIIILGLKLFLPQPPIDITFNVTGIENNTNATSLVELQFECIKYCSLHNQYPDKCWEQCEKLGK